MTRVWLAPKQEYDDDIANMDPRWVGDTVSTEYRDEALSQLVKILWAFQRSLSRQLSNPEDKAAFQAKLYKNIYPETAKVVIAAYHHLDRAMRKISNLVNRLPIHFLERMRLVRIS